MYKVSLRPVTLHRDGYDDDEYDDDDDADDDADADLIDT